MVPKSEGKTLPFFEIALKLVSTKAIESQLFPKPMIFYVERFKEVQAYSWFWDDLTVLKKPKCVWPVLVSWAKIILIFSNEIPEKSFTILPNWYKAISHPFWACKNAFSPTWTLFALYTALPTLKPPSDLKFHPLTLSRQWQNSLEI